MAFLSQDPSPDNRAIASLGSRKDEFMASGEETRIRAIAHMRSLIRDSVKASNKEGSASAGRSR